MLKRKWKSISGITLVALAAALALAACDEGDRVSDARDTAERTVGQNDIGAPPAHVAEDDARTGGGAITRTDPVTEGLDNPFKLAGRSVDTADGEHLGQITKLVTDDAQNVYAVIEMDGADKTSEASGSLVVDVEKIDRSKDDLVLMSQGADLEPYVPENYKPLGVRTEP